MARKTGEDNLIRGIAGKRGKRNFTKPERKRMVDVLALNDWNYNKTAIELKKSGINVSVRSLKDYKREFEDQIENLPEKYIKGWEQSFAKANGSLIQKQLKLHELIVDKLIELVPQVTNLQQSPGTNVLVNIMTALNNATSGANKENDYEKTDSLVDMINNHLDKQNKFRDEQKSKLTGDIQDVTFEPVD